LVKRNVAGLFPFDKTLKDPMEWGEGFDGKYFAVLAGQFAQFNRKIAQVGADVGAIITRTNQLFQEIYIIIFFTQQPCTVKGLIGTGKERQILRLA